VLHRVLTTVIEIYLWGILFPRAILSWFPVTPGSVLSSVNLVLYRLTEPVLAPVRRILPPLRAGNMGIDLSFIVVFVGLNILAVIV